jgi:hypothetical protein
MTVRTYLVSEVSIPTWRSLYESYRTKNLGLALIVALAYKVSLIIELSNACVPKRSIKTKSVSPQI